MGYRLDKFLAEEISLKDFIPTRSYAQNMIEKGFVLINGKIAKTSHALKKNDSVMIGIPAKKSSELIPYDFPLDIIFEDNDLLVINKPAGLVIHPAVGHEQDTLVNALLHHTKNLSMKNEERPGIVHRIDKDTSGLIVVAKNDETHEKLATQFKNKTTHRVYFAILDGAPKNGTGTLQSYLARHPTDRKKYSSVRVNNKILTEYDPNFEKGKWAVTHYEVLQKSQSKSLVKVKLETGRTHQIRAHMFELGHPLVGDLTYNYSEKKMKELAITRFYLHAAELGFVHPKTNQSLMFKVDWPAEDLKNIKSWGFILP